MRGPARRHGTPEGCLLNRPRGSRQIGSLFYQPLQPFEPGLEVGVLGKLRVILEKSS